jgi:transposase
MMGRQTRVQSKLFYTAINLEQRIRKNHVLRKVKRQIDFDFIYDEVKDKYGINGNESVAPTIILKMLLPTEDRPAAAPALNMCGADVEMPT